MRTKPRPAAAVIEWLRDNDDQNAVSPVVLAELEYGILILPHGRRRLRLEQWFYGGVATIPVLDIDAQTAHAWAALTAVGMAAADVATRKGAEEVYRTLLGKEPPASVKPRASKRVSSAEPKFPESVQPPD